MVTVLRVGALRVVIYANDHEPPHVHVFGDGETKIVLGREPSECRVLRTIGANLAESRRALKIVREHRADLLRRWDGLHG